MRIGKSGLILYNINEVERIKSMNNIETYNQDNILSFKKYETQNLSYSIFKDIDFHNYVQPISFFRSDFRGSKFENISFYKNNFDRADFLDSIFIDCEFEKVNFGCSQIKNCYFENGTFKNNSYRNTSIHSTTFVNCNFPDESFLVNMQHCKLINCTFNGCSFEMSTTDSDVFETCIFENSNLATMHAENHTFINCKFNNVYMDSSYFFGYSISKCNLQNIKFLYRGEYVEFDTFNLKELAFMYDKENRFNDLINLLKYSKKQTGIPNVIKGLINHCSHHPYGRMFNLSTAINTLVFSAMYEEIEFNVLYETYNLLENEKWSDFSFSEKNEVEAMIAKFKNALFLTSYSDEYLSSINQNHFSSLTISFINDDYNYCLNCAEKILGSYSQIKCWELIDKQHGSWILTFALPTILLLYILPRIIKNFSDVYFDIKTKKALSKKLLTDLTKPNITSNHLEKIQTQISSAQLLMDSGKFMNENDLKDIQSIIANI